MEETDRVMGWALIHKLHLWNRWNWNLFL